MSIITERMKYNQSAFLHDLYSTLYKHLQNINAEMDVETFISLSPISMSLRSYKDPIKILFATIQQRSDDKLVTFSYMVEVNQEVTVVLPILLLLLKTNC